jgi:hypothetical protein
LQDNQGYPRTTCGVQTSTGGEFRVQNIQNMGALSRGVKELPALHTGSGHRAAQVRRTKKRCPRSSVSCNKSLPTYMQHSTGLLVTKEAMRLIVTTPNRKPFSALGTCVTRAFNLTAAKSHGAFVGGTDSRAQVSRSLLSASALDVCSAAGHPPIALSPSRPACIFSNRGTLFRPDHPHCPYRQIIDTAVCPSAHHSTHHVLLSLG